MMTTFDLGVPPVALSFDGPANTVWAAGHDGSVRSLRLLDGARRTQGRGYTDPVAVIALADGLRVAVAERSGELWVAPRDRADRSTATPLATLDGAVLSVGLDGHDLVVLVDHGGTADLVVVDGDDGSTRTLAAGLVGALALTTDPTRGRSAVLHGGSGDDQDISLVDRAGDVSTLASGARGGVALVDGPPGSDGVLVVEGSGDLLLVGLDGSQVRADGAGPPSGATRWGSLLLLGTTDGTLTALEWLLDDGPLPMTLGLGPITPGGWARLRVDLAGQGLTLDDVEFAVAEGADAGTVSAGREPTAADGTEGIVVLGGAVPGEYHVQAVERSSGGVLATRRFRVSWGWPDPDSGPPVAITGPRTLAFWGGTGALPDYTLREPVPAEWRVAVVMVSTNEGAWTPVEAAALRTAWEDRVVGSGLSARTYVEEVSFRSSTHGTTIDLVGGRVFGPVTVPVGWGTAFEPSDPGDVNDGWIDSATGDGWLAGAVSAFLADEAGAERVLDRADAVVLVVRTPTEPLPKGTDPSLPIRHIHPVESDVQFQVRRDELSTTYRDIPTVVMPDRYPPTRPSGERGVTRALCHELGHTMGLDDLYDAEDEFPAEVGRRLAGRIDLMDRHSSLPHLSVANRMRLGWLPPSWVRVFDFRAAQVGGEVVLHAIEGLSPDGPPPGESAAVEVRVDDGWSYFFEYRREQPGQVGDQRLELLDGEFHDPAHTALLVGTDVRVGPPGTAPEDQLPFVGGSARPPILRLPLDVDDDGPVLVAGEDYQDSDTTNRDRMFDFVARPTELPRAADRDTATLEIEYVGANRPQLLIHPAPGRGDFRSPDIELLPLIPFLPPFVLKGATNTILVRVWNNGTLDAADARIRVGWLPFTTTPGPVTRLPDPDPVTVPARGSTEIRVDWPVPDSGELAGIDHFCVQVEITRWTDPRPGHADDEIVVFDNWAQSNFSTSWLAHGSPSERSSTVVRATNTRRRAARYDFRLQQTGDLFRAYLDSTWRRLGPGETATVGLAYESLAGDPTWGPAFEEASVEAVPSTTVSVSTAVDPGAGLDCRVPRQVFGGTVDLFAGRRCWVSEVGLTWDGVRAVFRCGDPAAPEPVTHGSAHLAAWWTGSPGEHHISEGPVGADGEAFLQLSEDLWQRVLAGDEVLGVVARAGDPSFAQVLSAVTQLVEP